MSGREDLNLRPFGPETGWATSQAVLILRKLAKPLQAGRVLESSRPRDSQRMRNSTTHLLPECGTAPGATSARVGPPSDDVPGWGHVAPGTAARVRTTPTTAELVSYWGGRFRLLRVKEAAEQLTVPTWRVYQLCEDGELPHARITNSIRIRPGDLEEFIASRVMVPEARRSHRRKQPSE